MEEKRRGFFMGMFAAVGSAAKSTLGGEFFRGGKGLAHVATDALHVKTCPRCFELSMYRIGESEFTCTRRDVCGWSGSKEDADNLLAWSNNISPAVYAISKGINADVKKAVSTNKIGSWLLWVVVASMLTYAVYLYLFHTIFLFVWVLMLASFFAMQAIKFAYRVQYLQGVFKDRPSQFLLNPRLWFVV